MWYNSVMMLVIGIIILTIILLVEDWATDRS
jgi:hypothetical protein